jgi:hypothetical protein
MMNRFMMGTVAALLCCSTAMAQTCPAAGKTQAIATAGQDKNAKSEGDCAKSCGDKAGCCAKSYAAMLPAMKYKVGDATVECPDKAKELAKGDAKSIKFVVGTKSFDDVVGAEKELTSAYETFTTEATTVKYAVGDKCVSCPMSAGELAKKENKKMAYRLASYDFASEEAAKKAIASAKEAAGKVELKTMVGDKCVACPVEAKELANKEHKKVEYVVGESKTCCDVEAKMNLAKARALATLAALEKASKGNA